MRIAWVEDNLGHFETGVKAILKGIFPDWRAAFPDLFVDTNAQSIADFFEGNSLHNLDWFNSYSSAQATISNQSKFRWDVVILDLDLSAGFDQKTYPLIDAKKAGFALYLQLLRSGFPAECIVFSTNNAKETAALNEECQKYGFPKPSYLDKESEELTQWLGKHLGNDRLTLRRGILDGCDFMRRLLTEQPSTKIRINDCVYDTSDDNGKLDAVAVSDWLEAWPKLLPDISLERREKDYAVFLLALLSIWDGKKGLNNFNQSTSNNSQMAQALQKAKGNSASVTQDVDSDEGFNVIPFILKRARNWISHGSALHDATVPAVAFLFLLAGRGLVCNARTPLRHEKILLLLISGLSLSDDSKRRDEVKTALREKAKSTLESAAQKEQNEQKKQASSKRLEEYNNNRMPYFNQMANDYVYHAPDLNFEYSPEQLLMLSLLIEVKPEPDRSESLVGKLRTTISSQPKVK